MLQPRFLEHPIVDLARRFGVTGRQAITIIALYLGSILLEGIGLSVLLPVVQFIANKGDISKLAADSQLWRGLLEFGNFLNIEITLSLLLITCFVCIMARQAVAYTRLKYNAKAVEMALWKGRNLVFNGFLRVDIAYTERTLLGNIINDFMIEIRNTVLSIFNLISLVGLVGVFIVYLGMMMLLSPAMTLTGIACLTLTILALGSIMRRSREAGGQVTKANKSMATFLAERLRALRLIRLSNTQQAEATAMSRLTGQHRDRMIHLQALGALTAVLLDPVLVGLSFICLYLGTQIFNLDIAEVSLFVVAVMRLTPLAGEFMRGRQSLLGHLGSTEAVIDRLHELEQQREPAGGSRHVSTLANGVHFEGVNFSYGELPALRDVSVSIPARKVTAIVGPSGAGKSTLIDLLPRLRDANSGEIFFDGVSIRDIHLPDLRALIAYAPQTPHIFNVTAAEHIRYGRPDATDEEVRLAAMRTGAAAFIEAMPNGYDTIVGESGVRLSGGQRQRLDLARTLVSKASLLILDEPTSNLDADTEEVFRETLYRIRDEIGLTVVIVAHRLSTIARADQIVVMRNGRVEQIGTHASLLASGGWYAQAFTKQHSSDVPEQTGA